MNAHVSHLFWISLNAVQTYILCFEPNPLKHLCTNYLLKLLCYPKDFSWNNSSPCSNSLLTCLCPVPFALFEIYCIWSVAPSSNDGIILPNCFLPWVPVAKCLQIQASHSQEQCLKDLLSQCFKASCVLSYLDIWNGKIRECIPCQTLLKQIVSVSLFVLFDHHIQWNYSVHRDRCTYSTFLCSPYDGYHKRLQLFGEFNIFCCLLSHMSKKK